jgi:diguanylate cyclase
MKRQTGREDASRDDRTTTGDERPDDLRAENRWSFALESAGLGVWDADLVTNRCYYSTVWKAMLGFEEHEVGDDGDFWLTLVHPDDRERAILAGQSHEAGLSPIIETEFRLRHKDGHWVWVLDRGKVIERDAEGRPTRMIGVQTDITRQKEAESHLALLNARMRLAALSGGVGLWHFDPSTDTLHWDERMFELYGSDPSGFRGRSIDWEERIHPEDRAKAAAEFHEAVGYGAPFNTVFRIVRPDGSVRHVQALARAVDNAEMPIVLVGTNWDVTDAVLAAQALREEKERLRITLESIADAVISTDVEARVTYMNPAAELLTGRPEAEAIGRALTAVFQPVREDNGLPLPCPGRQAIDRGAPVEQEVPGILIRQDGSQRSVRAIASPVSGADGVIVGSVLAVQDVTSARALQRDLEYVATHDTLTGLKNRVAFEAALAETIAQASHGDQQHALLYVDLDRFKIVNDIAGHAAGDALLKKVAKTLTTMVRAHDVVARLGGDEFAVLLLFCSPDEAERRAECIIQMVGCERFAWADKQHEVGASIGVSPIDRDSGSAERVLAHADIACYSAKAAGRNQVAVYRSDAGDARRHLADLRVASGISQAVEQDRFCLYAQEIRSLASPLAKGSHIEILTRMVAPDGSLVSPGAFIPAAERFDLMGALDRWVVRTTLSRYGAEIMAVPDFSVAMNLSANSLSDPALWAFVAGEIGAAEIDPSRLIFEITETAVINNFGAAERFVADARALGCRISLDDFGSGVSSFSYLKRFSVDSIKIDGAFVKAMATSRYDRTIVRLITEIAEELGVATIAECIEDTATVAELCAIGVRYGQGYLFHRPRPLDEVLGERLGAAARPRLKLAV